MLQPEELKKDEPLTWSPGRGSDVWAMFCAAIDGDLKTMRRLVESDPALARCHYHYRTPLYFAVRENRIAAVRFLLEHGADPHFAVGDTLVQIARDRGYSELEDLLDSSKGNALAAAIRDRNLVEVRRLLDSAPELLYAADDRSNLPIHWAVMTRQIELIDDLLDRGADISARRGDGARPVQLVNGDYDYRGWRDVPEDVKTTPREVLDHLLKRGAYLDICTASHMGDLERVRELLEHDPSLANRVSEYVTYYLGSGAPLRNAAACGHIDIVRLLLEYGADPNLREEGIAPNGHALYSAVYRGHYEIAKLLLESGANANAPVESSADALSIAIRNGNEQMIDLLASYGAARSVELLAYYGDLRTAAAVFAANPALADDPVALSNAASNGHDSFVRLMLRYCPRLAERISTAAKTRDLTEFLLRRGMNPNLGDWLGVAPLHNFARRGDLENAALFLDWGAGIDARDEDICSTPLAWAAKFGQKTMVEFLLDRGAKTNLPDDPPWATPMAWATRRGHTTIIPLLQRHGAS